MRYAFLIHREGNKTLAEFPDCPGCQTFAGPRQDITEEAAEALQGWLEAHLVTRRVPPRPKAKHRTGRGQSLGWAVVPPKLAVKLDLRWARETAGLTQKQLAEKAGVSQPAIAQLEDPDSNPTIDTLQKVAGALGATLEVSITRAA